MYFIRGGILDRQAGLTLCLMISTYELFIRAKFIELVRNGGVVPSGVSGLAVAEGGGSIAAQATVFPAIAAGPVPAPAMQPPPIAPPAVSRPAPQIAPRRSPAPRSVKSTKINISSWNPMENFKRALWMIVRAGLFRPSFHNWYGWRRLLLELFGAKLGKGVRIRPTALVEIPWNLEIGDDVVVGDYAILYSLGKITIGRGATISQYAHLCAGTHDYTSRRFPLLKPPIVIGEEVWVAADAFVGPGVTLGDRSVVGARATVVKDVPADQVVIGPAATVIKERVYKD
jgi:putative colanic acid biosynthesis acetyltransferase WcaF